MFGGEAEGAVPEGYVDIKWSVSGTGENLALETWRVYFGGRRDGRAPRGKRRGENGAGGNENACFLAVVLGSCASSILH